MVSDWVLEESASVDLGDERLNDRYARILSSIGNRPNLSIPAGCLGRAEMEATYRFTDNPRVTFQKILAPHRRQTLARVAKHAVALFVQDTTELDLTRPQQQVVGAGGLDGSSRRGLFAHLLHAFASDGTPLGTVSAQIINRPDEPKHKGKGKRTKARKDLERVHKPIERKESMRWLDGLRAVREAAGQLPDTRCICIADSEADIYELLAEPREAANGRSIDFIFLACRDRALEMEAADDDPAPDPKAPAPDASPPRHLREAAMATPALYTVQMLIRGRGAKLGLNVGGRRQAREARQAMILPTPDWRASVPHRG